MVREELSKSSGILKENTGQVIKEFGDLVALLSDKETTQDIVTGLSSLPAPKTITLGKQIESLYNILFKLSNSGYESR